MWVEAKLILSSYIPRKLKQGMYFIQRGGEDYEVYELEHDIASRDSYITEHGHPIELLLYDTSLKICLAHHGEIAWVDEGDDSEDMHEITLDDINSIIKSLHTCQIKIKDKLYQREKLIIPIYDEEKVIIRLIEEETE